MTTKGFMRNVMAVLAGLTIYGMFAVPHVTGVVPAGSNILVTLSSMWLWISSVSKAKFGATTCGVPIWSVSGTAVRGKPASITRTYTVSTMGTIPAMVATAISSLRDTHMLIGCPHPTRKTSSVSLCSVLPPEASTRLSPPRSSTTSSLLPGAWVSTVPTKAWVSSSTDTFFTRYKIPR